MPSGPGAEEGEHLLRASFISSWERRFVPGCGESLPLAGGGGLGGKKYWRSAVFIEVGVSAAGSVGKRGVFRGATYCLAVQMFWGVVLAKKFDQYDPLACLIALKYPSLESLAK